MAYYKVGSDGKAPANMAVGDYVVTGGGTWDIKNVLDAAAAKYETGTHNPNLTTYNFTGQYANAPQTSTAQQVAQATSPASAVWGQNGSTMQSGAINKNGTTTVSNPGEGKLDYDAATGRLIRTMPDGQAWYVEPTDAKYNALYQEYYNGTGQDPRGMYGAGAIATGAGMMQSAAGSQAQNIAGIQSAINALTSASAPAYQAPNTAAEKAQFNNYLQQLNNLQYTPVDKDTYLGKVGTYEDYVQQAVDALTPGYKKQYQQAYDKGAQQLGYAGLFDSLYGQALMAQQQNAVTDALMAEAATKGLDLQQRAYDQAMAEYQAAISENQFGHTNRRETLTAAGDMTMDYINVLNNEAKNQNDYNMQAYLAKLEQYTAAIDGWYKSGSLTNAEYENMMTAANIELSKVEAQLKSAEIANTNADTEKIKAQTQAIMAELAGFSGAASGSGYGYGSGYSYSGGDDEIIYTDNSKDAAIAAAKAAIDREFDKNSPYNYTLNKVNSYLANGDKTGAYTAVSSQMDNLTDDELKSLNTAIKAYYTGNSGKLDDKPSKVGKYSKGVGFNA